MRQNRMKVDTIGWSTDRIPNPLYERHYDADFNIRDDNWCTDIPVKKYDLVVACEVIEHFTTSLGLTLKRLKELTLPGGYILVQTPNAVALKNRMAFLIGRNPFHMMMDYEKGHNHIREFTMEELVKTGEAIGLK